ncbi:MAG: ATP-binding protein [Acidobacteria bacterium]|nr:ATP-binding protein [Acidobacteriota bacterium]
MPGNSTVTRVVLQHEPNAELGAGRLVEEVGLRAGFTRDTLAEVKLAVVEACLNAFEYGGGDIEVEIAVRPADRSPCLEVVVTDHGPGFDPQAVPVPDLPAKLKAERKRGWGLQLMRRLMDEVVVSSRPGLTRVRMRRYRGGE